LIHGGVVPRRSIDQDSWIFDYRHVAQDLRQLGWAELAGSAGAVRERGQANSCNV
jgi:hypothetical protein